MVVLKRSVAVDADGMHMLGYTNWIGLSELGDCVGK